MRRSGYYQFFVSTWALAVVVYMMYHAASGRFQLSQTIEQVIISPSGGGGVVQTYQSQRAMTKTQPEAKDGAVDVNASLADDKTSPMYQYYKLIADIMHFADENKTIMVSYVEMSYVDLAMNFYHSSLLRWNITNYVMISSDRECCAVLNAMGVHCVFDNTPVLGSGNLSRYGSKEFKKKTHAKTRIVRDILKFGYTVIFTDVDIVYLLNPIPYLQQEAVGFDFVIQREGKGGDENSGFYLVKPVPETVYVFSKICEREDATTRFSEQIIMVNVLKGLRANKFVKQKLLDYSKYPAGIVYWEYRQHMFTYEDPWNWVHDPNNLTVIVHNNWIVGKPAKIYRFKESNLWRYDKNGYYSKTHTKYISYSNPYSFDNKTDLQLEENALKNALSIGYLLNRVVILPQFNCKGCKEKPCQPPEKACSLQAHFNIETFDKHISDKYREHVFLSNPLTPQAIQASTSDAFLIESTFVTEAVYQDRLTKTTSDVIKKPEDKENGASPDEILKWFGDIPESVLQFHSLYDAFQGFPNDTKYQEINDKLRNALKKGNYRQY